MTSLWDEDLVRSLFLPADAERILRIPLSPHLTEDFIAWHHTKSYVFSVRSAYYVEWEYQFGHKTRRGDGQGSSQVNPVWEKIWNLNVPSKVQIFTWKALHGVVPGMAVLASRHIKVQPQCPICSLGPEDIKHLLFGCTRATEVWRELGLLNMIKQAMIVDRSGSVVLEHILCSSNNNVPMLEQLKTHELVVVGCWYIWWQRRQIVKGENVSAPASSAFAITALAANYGAATKKPEDKEIRWSKPPKGHRKLNIDASYYQYGSGAAGMVLRNDKGEAIAGKACLLNNMMCAENAEATALLKGLEFLEQIGCFSAYIESDSLELIKACNGDIEIWSPYTAVLADCFQKARSMDLVFFQHCPRDANVVAHNLAKMAYESRNGFGWDGRPPDFILSDVIRDVTM